MARIAIFFVHPALEKSRVHRRLLRAAREVDDVVVHDLYEAYPDFFIDVRREQQLVESHDVLIFQFPFFWYNTPALLKQWFDLVLEHGWAYGTGGDQLRGKTIVTVISTGGRESAYLPDGLNRFTMRQLLAPLEQTFHLCGARFLAPLLIQGVHRLEPDDFEPFAAAYRRLLEALRDERLDLERATRAEMLLPLIEELEVGDAR